MWLHRRLPNFLSHSVCPRYTPETTVLAWLFVSTSCNTWVPDSRKVWSLHVFTIYLYIYISLVFRRRSTCLVYNLPHWSSESFVAWGGRYPCATHDCRCLLYPFVSMSVSWCLKCTSPYISINRKQTLVNFPFMWIAQINDNQRIKLIIFAHWQAMENSL